MFMNPKFVAKASYMILFTFGAYHFSKLFYQIFMGMATGLMLARFGKPSLVRETSSIFSNSKNNSMNYFKIPFTYASKVVTSRIKKSEKDLLNGVILDKKLED